MKVKGVATDVVDHARNQCDDPRQAEPRREAPFEILNQGGFDVDSASLGVPNDVIIDSHCDIPSKRPYLNPFE